jgi:hypothetical protein
MTISCAGVARAQNAAAPGGQPVVQQPVGASVVNYQNGLEALGQAPPADQSPLVPGLGNNDLLLGLGLVAVGGVVVGVLASQDNNNPSVSP